MIRQPTNASVGYAGAQCAAVIDLDNLAVRKGRRARLNVAALARELRERGVTVGVVLAASVFTKEVMRWRKHGFKFVATRSNADPEIAWYVRKFARRGVPRVIVCSGDGALGLDIMRDVAPYNVTLEFWAPFAKFSAELWRNADRVFYLDRFLETPKPGDVAALFARTSAAPVLQ